MRWLFSLASVFIFAGTVVFASPQEMASVTGRVFTPDGKPVAKSTVWLVVNRWEVGRMTVESVDLTDAKGNFKLPFKPPLRVYSAYVVAHHPNYAVGWKSFDPRDLKPLTVRLHNSAPLTGIVLTPDGKPLAGAKLQVWEIESVRLRSAFEVTGEGVSPQIFGINEEMPEEVSPFWTVTDSHGRFVFQNLPANAQVSLRVHHPDYAPALFPPSDEWDRLRTGFPIRTGMAEVAVVAIPKSFVRGKVLVNGQLIENAQVFCRSRFYGEKEYHAVTDVNGEFEIPLHAGHWFIYAFAENGKWQCEPQFIPIAPNQTISLTLNLQRAVEVTGIVKDAETKKTVPFAEVYGDRQFQFEIQGEPPAQEWWRSKPVKADEQGNFRLFLLPGKWTISAWASYSPEHFANFSREVEVKGESMELTDLLLQTPPKLSVQVVDEKGKPVPRAIISDGWWISRRADERGIAQIEYSPQTLWAASPDLTMFGKVDVKPEEKSVRIVVKKGIPVSGQVTDENGKPVSNARVRVQVFQRYPGFAFEMTNDWFEVFSDKKGQFRFHLPSGLKFQLLAFAEGFFPTEPEPYTSENKPITVTVKMRRLNFVLEGKVLDGETGQPIWGAAVRIWLMLGGSLPDWGVRVAFTNEQGQFKLTDLHSEHLGEITVYHPLYQLFQEWQLSKEQQIVVRMERRRPVFTPQLAVGKPAPTLSDVNWLDGEVPSLQGKTTYLLFAMPYDPACEQTMQRLKEFQAKSPEKVQVIVVFDASLPADELRKYVSELQLPFRFGVVPEGRLSGWDSETFQLYGVKSLPMLVVIDEQGIVKTINPEGS